MSGNFKIANLGDISTINTLVDSAFRGENSKKGWTSEADLLGGIRTNEAQLVELLNDPKNEFWLYLENDALLGCVNLSNKGDLLYLGMLSVSPDAQGKGIGKKFLELAETRAKEQRKSGIEMTVISQRKELIDWYIRHDYHLTGETRPFPVNNPNFGEPKTFLEFVVLVKIIK